MVPLESLMEGWHAFFHGPQSLLGLGVFRIAFGMVLIANGLLLWREGYLFFAPRGFLAQRFFLTRPGRSLFRYLPPHKASVYATLSLLLLASFFLLLGFYSRASAAVIFIILVSLYHRNPLVHHSGDAVLRWMSFLLIFSPAGEILAVDAWYSAAQATDEDPTLGRSPWCLRLMQLQLSILYFRAFWSKITAADWLNGTAVYFPTRLPDYRRLKLRLLRHGWVHKPLTWGVIVVEFALCSLIWIDEFRLPVVLAGLAFHLGIEIFLNLQLFGWTMMVCLLLFLEPQHYRLLSGLLMG